MFDKFAEMAKLNNFDYEPYIKYCIRHGITESTIDVCLASTKMLDRYAMHVKKLVLRKKIYKWVIKSAKNIAKRCIDEGYFTAKDFLRMLLESKGIGQSIV